MKRVWLAVALSAIACGRAGPPTVKMPELDGPIAARATPDDDFRSKPPGIVPLAAVAIPKIEERRLKNGIRVLFVERHDVPVIALRVVSDRGADQADAGIPEFWMRAAMMASDTHPYWEVNETTNGLGMDLAADVTHDETMVSIRVLSKLFPAATELLADLVAHPSFPNSRLTLVRQRMRASLSKVYGDPEGQLVIAMHHALYPAAHRYHHPVAPTETIDKVTAEILTAYQRFAFTPAHMTLAVAGDTTIDALMPILERGFGTLQGPKVGAQAPPAPPPELLPEPRFLVVDEPTGSQAHIAVTWLGPTVDVPDKFAFLLALESLGHALNTDLRVKKGITYGAHLFGGTTRGRTPVGVSTAVEVDRVGDAAAAMIMYGELLATQRLEDTLLAGGKTALIGSRAYFDGTAETASSLARFSAYALPLDYPMLRAKAITACTAEEVRAAAERWLPPSRMRIVIVGEAAKVIPQLQKVSPGKILRISPFSL
jgi:zinc protease